MNRHWGYVPYNTKHKERIFYASLYNISSYVCNRLEYISISEYTYSYSKMFMNHICPYGMIFLRYNYYNRFSYRPRFLPCKIQYIPRNMHTVFALLCFVVVIHWLIFPYPPGLLHWHCGNVTIAPVPAKQPWWIWINTSCEFIMNDCITTTKQSTTKPCAYFLGYTVPCKISNLLWHLRQLTSVYVTSTLHWFPTKIKSYCSKKQCSLNKELYVQYII